MSTKPQGNGGPNDTGASSKAPSTRKMKKATQSGSSSSTGRKSVTNTGDESSGSSLWIIVLALVAGLCAVLAVPGPLQDRVLVTMGLSEDVRKAGRPTGNGRGQRIKLYTDKDKRDEVVEAFKHAWFAYERDAFGSDEYHPISREGTNISSTSGIGYTIIDTLDTLLLFAQGDPSGPGTLQLAYQRARKWVRDQHTWDVDVEFSTFEITIRMLGGLLSAWWMEHEDPTTMQLLASAASKAPLSMGSKKGPDDLLLEKAADLARRLGGAFETHSGLPISNINLKTSKGSADKGNKGLVSTAEVGTLQLEFRYLSHILSTRLSEYQLKSKPRSSVDEDEDLDAPTYLIDEYGELMTLEDTKRYWELVENVMRHTREGTRGRLPSIFMNPADGQFVLSPIRLGSRGDSYYEYLLKQYLQTEKTEEDLLRMYDDAMDGIHESLSMHTPKRSLHFIAELMPETDNAGNLSWRREPKQDHLVCFLAGSLMLGAASTLGKHDPNFLGLADPSTQLENDRSKRDWKSGDQLLRSCWETHKTGTGLAPEIAHFRTASEPGWVSSKVSGEWYIKGAEPGFPVPIDARYILRPETIESLFIAYRLTGDGRYRRWGWSIFQAIQKHCRIKTGGYAGVYNVDTDVAEHEDKMETFFLSETLKYLYLLFSDETVLPLDEIVFNTEAHPLPRFKPLWRTSFMSNVNSEWKVQIPGW